MNDSENGVTVLDRIDDDPDSHQVIDFAELFFRVLHFVINRVNMLRTSIDFRCDLHIIEYFVDLFDDRTDECFPLRPFLFHHRDDPVVLLRIDITQTDILKLPLDRRNPETMGKRRKDFKCLFCLLDLLFLDHVLQCPHVVQTVSEFDQNDANVFCHRDKHLTMVFSKLFTL